MLVSSRIFAAAPSRTPASIRPNRCCSRCRGRSDGSPPAWCCSSGGRVA